MGFTELAGIRMPRELFDAAKNGELVVFAGAGVSMQGDSPLPDFGNLVNDISRIVDPAHKLKPFDGEKDVCEEYLGELEALYGGAVRAECARELSGGTYAKIHRNIISLFDSNPIRVVTTNFDRRFEQAADDLGIRPRIFSGPALPVGDSFEGLVHLHGSVGYPDEMILSDSDFGKAYVSDGWASRFLVKMFSRYTVLFVGYSFADTLVQYLARSISADVKGKVFALEREEDKLDSWSKRGIIPISFDSFDQLPNLFYEWHRRDSITIYECSKTVEHVAKNGFESPFEDREELVRLLTESDAAEQAAYAEVYTLAEQNFSAVKLLVDLGLDGFLFKEELSKRDLVFSAWVARTYAMTDCVQLIRLAAEKGKPLSRNLCSRVLLELCRAAPNYDCLSTWASYLEPTMIDNGGSGLYCLWRIIEDCRAPQLAFSWIRKLFAVKAVCSNDLFGKELKRLKSAFVFEGEGFSQQLIEAIGRHSNSLGWDLFWCLVDRLEEARDIETAYGANRDAFDSWSYGRSAIEEHEQDERSKGLIDVLVAVLRDTGCAMMPECKYGLAVVERCFSSSAHLVKRLGLYLLQFIDTPPNCSVRFLIEHECLRDSYLIHETFRLLSTAYPGADSGVKAAFIEEVREAYPDVSDADDAYSRFNVLKWLEKFSGEDEIISAELASIHESFPNFEVREYPDFNHYMTLGLDREADRYRVEEGDFTPEKLRELCLMAEKSHSMLRKWDIVSAPMRQYPGLCLNVATQLLSSSEGDYREMAQIALSSIRWEDIEDESLCKASEVIIAGLQSEDTYPFAVRALGAFVDSSKETLLEKTYLWRPALDLASENLGWLSSENYAVVDSSKCDWLTVSINRACGVLVGTIAKAVYAASSVDDDEARKFGMRYIGKLVSRLELQDDCSRCMAASLFSEVNIWIFVDAELMELVVSQIFVPEHPLLIPAWQGLSYVSRLTENSWIILKECFVQFLSAVTLDDKFLSHLGSLFVWGTIVYGNSDDRRDAVAIASTVSSKACSAVSFRLLDWVGQLKDDERIVEWQSWLGDAVRSMFESDENFKVAGHYLVRWLAKCGCLAPEAGRLLINWRKRECDKVFFDKGSLGALIANGATDDTERALLLVFFLSNVPAYHSSGEFDEVAKRLDVKGVSKAALSELRDSFIIRFASVPACLE